MSIPIDLDAIRATALADWREPEPIADHDVQASLFPIDALGKLGQVAADIQDATKGPAGLASASVLATAAFAAQGTCDVQFVKQTRRPLSLFIITIGASGERKSSADRFAQIGVRRHVSKLQQAYQAAMLLSTDGELPSGVRDPNIVIGTGSVEGIARGFSEGHPSQALFNDEGGAFLSGHSLRKENRMAGLAALSKFWDGTGYLHRVRGQGNRSEIVATLDCRLTTHLLGQRVAVLPLLEDSMARGQGLLARFLIHEPPSTIGKRIMTYAEWQQDAKTPAIEEFADDVEYFLCNSCPRSTEGNVPRPKLRLADSASRALFEYAMTVERALAPMGEYGGFADITNKVHEQAARISGTLAVFRKETEVSGRTMSDAIEIADYFLREIVRLMNVSHQDAVAKDALLVANWLHARGDSCMIKEFSQGGPKRLRKVANRAPAFELLYRAGWMKEAGSSLVLNPLCSERGLLSIDSAANDANGAI